MKEESERKACSCKNTTRVIVVHCGFESNHLLTGARLGYSLFVNKSFAQLVSFV